jgi:hypothetical protein
MFFLSDINIRSDSDGRLRNRIEFGPKLTRGIGFVYFSISYSRTFIISVSIPKFQRLATQHSSERNVCEG